MIADIGALHETRRRLMCGLSFWLVCGGVCRLPMGQLGRLFVRVNSPIANGNRASNSALLRCPYEPRSTEEERRIRDETPGRKRAPHERQWRLSLPPLAGITTRGRVVGGRSPPSLVLRRIATRRGRRRRTTRARLRRRSEKGCVFDQTLVLGIDHRNYASSPFVRLRKRPTSVRIWEIGWLGAGVLLLM